MGRVADRFDIDVDVLTDKADESDYWARSMKFYMEVQDRDTETLSSSQMDWLHKMERSLGDAS